MSANDKSDAINYRKLKEKEKNYNAKYYSENKEKILASLLKKTVCSICKRKVNYQHIPRHQKSVYCMKRKCVEKHNDNTDNESDDDSDDE